MNKVITIRKVKKPQLIENKKQNKINNKTS